MHGRRGFSFVELLVVLTVMGLLVRFALPRYGQLRQRAIARAVLGDVHAVRVAAYNYYGDRSSWPSDAPPGMTPPQLAAYLPNGFRFHRGAYTLDWETWTIPGKMLGNGAAASVIGVAFESADAKLSDAVREMAASGIPYFVSGNRLTFLLSSAGGNF